MIVWLARPPTHGALGTYIHAQEWRYGLAVAHLSAQSNTSESHANGIHCMWYATMKNFHQVCVVQWHACVVFILRTVDQWLWLYSVQLAAPGLPFYMCPLQEMEREVASLRGQLEAIEKLKYVNVHSCWQCSVTYIRVYVHTYLWVSFVRHRLYVCMYSCTVCTYIGIVQNLKIYMPSPLQKIVQ